MSELAARDCAPCKGGEPPLPEAQQTALKAQLDPGWEIVDGHHLRRVFKFKNFKQALDFVNRVGQMAEEQGHHPDIELAWGRAEIEIWTHKIDGLHEADFVFAAKCDRLF